MLTIRAKQILILAISASLIILPTMHSANAAIVTTEIAIQMADRQHRMDHVNEILSRENVRSALVAYGVDPIDAGTRVAALTDSELRILEARLEQLPAGGSGVVEVIGIVAIVLIILELLDITNFFSEF